MERERERERERDLNAVECVGGSGGRGGGLGGKIGVFFLCRQSPKDPRESRVCTLFFALLVLSLRGESQREFKKWGKLQDIDSFLVNKDVMR